MKKRIIQIAFICLVLLFSSGSCLSDQKTCSAPQSSSSRVLGESRRIVSNLRSTRYSHKTRVDEKSGTYILDCSSLACYILKRAAPASLSLVPVDQNSKHARAVNFYYTFLMVPTKDTRKGWQCVLKLMEAEPGDFIAWKKEPCPRKGSTGHVVIVMKRPVKEKDGAVRVAILDSSFSGHARDTRQKGDSGVGVGTVCFEVDKSGAPVAVYWSSRKRKPRTCPIAIGRAAGESHLRDENLHVGKFLRQVGSRVENKKGLHR